MNQLELRARPAKVESVFCPLLSAYHLRECFSYGDQKRSWKKINKKGEVISVQLGYNQSYKWIGNMILFVDPFW